MMLFFRSEERVSEWCTDGVCEPRPLVTVPQLWQLARRLVQHPPGGERPAARPRRDQGHLRGIGLADPFWDPQADRFAEPD